MPDNQAITIYRKDRDEPIHYVVSAAAVAARAKNGMPAEVIYKAEDGREGTIYLNATEIEAVIIFPVSIPSEE